MPKKKRSAPRLCRFDSSIPSRGHFVLDFLTSPTSAIGVLCSCCVPMVVVDRRFRPGGGTPCPSNPTLAVHVTCCTAHVWLRLMCKRYTAHNGIPATCLYRAPHVHAQHQTFFFLFSICCHRFHGRNRSSSPAMHRLQPPGVRHARAVVLLQCGWQTPGTCSCRSHRSARLSNSEEQIPQKHCRGGLAM